MIPALDRKLLRDIWHNKGQVLAIAVIVACGVGILVMSLGTIDSLDASREAYYRQNRFADIFATVKRAPNALAVKVARIEGVARVETRIVKDVTLDIAGMAEPALGHLVSLPVHGEPLLNAVTLASGRLPQAARVDEAVVNLAFAEAHGFRLGDSFEALINGRKRDVTIVGIGLSPEFIYARPPNSLVPDDSRYGILWMGRRALEAAFDMEGAFNDVSVSLIRDASPEQVIDELDAILTRYGGLGAIDREDQESHAFLKGEMDQLRIIATIIPPIFIVVSAFLLKTVLGRLIDVEREQIGILKAFGYTNRQIAEHYLKFAMVIAAVGLLLGYALGIWFEGVMTDIYMEFYKFPTLYYTPSALAFAAGAAVAIGTAAFGALGSVRKAAALAPAEAMISQPPAFFARRGILSFDVSQFFDGPTRMIIRHTLRWPGRSMTTVAGVAAATGLLLATLFSRDATDHMIYLIFERTGSYDAQVTFVEAQSAEILSEVARLPGVIAAEPGRAVAVRLRHGPRHENAAITGIDPAATMRKVVTPDLEALSVPEHGIVLSSQMAAMLDATRGDRITVEVLEGRRPTDQVYVSAIAEDYLGSPVYMHRRAIDRLMGEDEMLSSAFVQIDRQAEDAFYEAVKDRPMIGPVTLQRIALDMFRDTLDKSQQIMMTIYQLLSGSIAAGVVYNSVRIALSERARELASMRVLGFSRAEVSYILLGQSFILVLLALPLGCLFGFGLSAFIATSMTTELYRIPLVIDPSSYGVAVATTLAAAIVSALIVRMQIDRLDLIAVLKTRD